MKVSHTKSAPLGHKSGMSFREIKRNIYVTSTHFSCFLQNWSSCSVQFSSVQFSCSVVSNSLQPHESQHARPPCPSPSPGVHSDSRPSSPWCHPAISSSVVPFSSCPQSLPASESFPTVIIEILQQVKIPHLPKSTMAIQYHRRRSGISF